MSRPIELVPEPAHTGSWSTTVEKDPFEVPLEDKVGLLTAAAEALENVDGVRVGRGTMDLLRQRSWFVSSEGSDIEQTIFHTGAGIEATSVTDGEVQVRSYPGSFRGHFSAAGYELIEAMELVEHAAETAEEAVALLTADPCPDTTTTLVLDGHQTMLQVHESVGHPTELDRVLGMEAAFAGTSFVGIPDLGNLRYGSEHMNITSDATIDGGLGTFGYDDEGVEAQRIDLVKEGILVGFQSSRETAGTMGADRSNGTMRAEGWENFPLIRMTNINILPGAGSLEDLIADVDDGIFMATNKSWSIDDKRKNFQFGCEIAWEIKKGKLDQDAEGPPLHRDHSGVLGQSRRGRGPRGMARSGEHRTAARVSPARRCESVTARRPRASATCRSGRPSDAAGLPSSHDDARGGRGRRLDYPGADGVEVAITGSSDALTRYANSEIIQNTVRNEIRANVTAVVGTRIGLCVDDPTRSTEHLLASRGAGPRSCEGIRTR